jgi:hypothetical protein
MWEKKYQVSFHYLEGTPHHLKFLREAMKSNVKEISRTFGIVSS